MKKLILLGVLSVSIASFAQDSTKISGNKVQKGFGVSVMQVHPQFPGGEDSLQLFLRRNLVYPEKAKKEHIQGIVYVGFLVDKDGKVKNGKILSGAHELLDNEALRVVGIMPNWKPGTLDGNPKEEQYVLPIKFLTPPTKQQ